MTFDGKVALVTGVASGIGLATARRFAESGATVVLSDIQSEKGRQAADELNARGQSAVFAYADVGDHESVATLLSEVRERYGRLDFAFNNAGIEGTFGPIDQSNLEDWHRVMTVNLSSVY